jgi:hypothetical protein
MVIEGSVTRGCIVLICKIQLIGVLESHKQAQHRTMEKHEIMTIYCFRPGHVFAQCAVKPPVVEPIT